jgi:hypothetical protein
MHYQIYLPGVRGEGSEAMRAAGLGGIVADANWVDVLNGGPDGGAGALASWGAGDVAYLPTAYRWLPAFAREGLAARRYWVGIRIDSPPRPSELEYKTSLPGYPLELEDGQTWRLACAGMLPQVWRPDPEDGRPKLAIKQKYREFFDRSCSWFRQLRSLDAGALIAAIDASWWDFIVEALAINYRIVPELVLDLGMISTQNAIPCLGAILDGPLIREVETLSQKKSPDSNPTPAG